MDNINFSDLVSYAQYYDMLFKEQIALHSKIANDPSVAQKDKDQVIALATDYSNKRGFAQQLIQNNEKFQTIEMAYENSIRPQLEPDVQLR